MSNRVAPLVVVCVIWTLLFSSTLWAAPKLEETVLPEETPFTYEPPTGPLLPQPDASAAPQPRYPTTEASAANQYFAANLYRRFAKEKAAANLLFSPYSISRALIMSAEGAQGETALQMGDVLGFPDSLRSKKEDANVDPWDLTRLHQGMATIDRHMSNDDALPEVRAKLEKIARLRHKHQAIKDWFNRVMNQEEFYFSPEMDRVGRIEREVIRELDALRETVGTHELNIINSIWLEKTYPFKSEYVRTITQYYGRGCLFKADFRNAPDEVRKYINDWINDNTEGRIPNVLAKDDIDDLTRLVITNAIYFNGKWLRPLSSHEADFMLADGSQIKATLMSGSGTRYAAFRGDGSYFPTPDKRHVDQDPETGIYTPRPHDSRFGQVDQSVPPPIYPDSEGFTMAELPYQGEKLSMILIAPRDPKGLPAIEAILTPENLETWLARFGSRHSFVKLPRFEMKTEYELGTGGARPTGSLTAMGMPRAFVDTIDLVNGAEFGGMTDSSDPRDRLYISKVLHKATIKVNEKGTEATAATIGIHRCGSAARRPDLYVPFTPFFNADRPFIFLIRDHETGTILFMGRVLNPEK